MQFGEDCGKDRLGEEKFYEVEITKFVDALIRRGRDEVVLDGDLRELDRRS